MGGFSLPFSETQIGRRWEAFPYLFFKHREQSGGAFPIFSKKGEMWGTFPYLSLTQMGKSGAFSLSVLKKKDRWGPLLICLEQKRETIVQPRSQGKVC